MKETSTWIPAFAGMTSAQGFFDVRHGLDSRLRGNDDRTTRGGTGVWIPAFAGMTYKDKAAAFFAVIPEDSNRESILTFSRRLYVL